jgi:outer membrane protein assembly factor BamB
MRRLSSLAAVITAIIGGSLPTAGLADVSGAAGQQLVQDSNLPGGICLVISESEARLALDLARDDRFVVQLLCLDVKRLEPIRRQIRDADAYGRVSADSLTSDRLPYTDNLLNLVVVDGLAAGMQNAPSLGEILRVTAPLGTVYLTLPAGDDSDAADAWGRAAREAGCQDVRRMQAEGAWLRIVKPWPASIDEWTHFLHGADGNPVAADQEVAPPERYQWLGGPVWAQSHESDTNLRCLVSARGRLYYIVNEAPPSLAGPESPPDKWFLAARDAFNGLELWKIPIAQWGWREWKPSWFTPRPGVIPLNLDKRLVAAGDRLYVTLGFRAPVSEIDARTGQILRTFDGTERTSEILHVDGSLILTVLQDQGAVVQRIDLNSGQRVWQSQRAYRGTTTDYYRFTAMHGSVQEAKVDPTLDLATDGQTVALLDEDSVVGLDCSDGSQRWRTAFPLDEADHNAGRIKAGQTAWNGAMIVADGVVLHASPHVLAAFDGQTGQVLWKQPKKFLQHLWYEWQDVFVIDGLAWTWSAELAREPFVDAPGNSTWPVSLNGYDIHTGRLERQVPLGKIFKTHHHHRCYRNKATTRYVIASRRGSEFVDLIDGQHSVNNWVRGACHMGMVPANGLQYAPPHPCQCYIDEKLNGFQALAGGPRPSDQKATAGDRLQPGLAAGDDGADTGLTPQSGVADWPTFRGNAARAGFVDATLDADLRLLWQTPVGSRLAAPTSAGGLVFVPLIDEHQIVALRTSDGSEQWRFTAGARIDSPPTWDRGALLFGSADGWLYRLRAADGQLVWRLRGGPEERRIGAFGQLESAWPIHGSVLVDGGVVYCTAGRSSHLDGGLRMIAADATSGRILHEQTFAGPSYTVDNIEQNYQLPMGVLPDILRLEDDKIFMRSIGFDTSLVQRPGKSQLTVRGGFLDGAYFKRMPWTLGGSGHARVLVYDDTHVYGLRMFDSLEGLNPNVYFTPGRAGYLLFAGELSGGKGAWAQRVPIRGRGMAALQRQLCVAGPPDVVDPEDPLAAFEGRAGGVLRVVDKTDGQTVSEHRLSSPPVFNGIAVAGGRLLLTLEDGSVACFGGGTE